jgi:hypothetical protein
MQEVQQTNNLLTTCPKEIPIHFVSALYNAQPAARADYVPKEIVHDTFPKSLEIVAHAAIHQAKANRIRGKNIQYKYTLYTEAALADDLRDEIKKVEQKLAEIYGEMATAVFDVEVNAVDVPDIVEEFYFHHRVVRTNNIRLPSHRNPLKDGAKFLQMINCKVQLLKRVAAVTNAQYVMWIDAGFAKVLDKPVKPLASGIRFRDFLFTAVSVLNFERQYDCAACGCLERSIHGYHPYEWYNMPDWRYMGGWFIVRKTTAEFVAQSIAEMVTQTWMQEFVQSGEGRLTYESCIWAQLFDCRPRTQSTPMCKWVYSDTDERFLSFENVSNGKLQV